MQPVYLTHTQQKQINVKLFCIKLAITTKMEADREDNVVKVRDDENNFDCKIKTVKESITSTDNDKHQVNEIQFFKIRESLAGAMKR